MKYLARIILCALFAFGAAAADTATATTPWKPLFNGKDLEGWKVLDFGGAGPVEVKDGNLVIGTGAGVTGLRRTNDLLKSNYEVNVKAMKIDGGDFFCGLTFPVKDSHATLIVGGWGGSLVGISSIDSMDASENETTAFMRFLKNQWYDIKVRVTDKRILAWIDGEKLIDVNIEGRRISLRPGDIEECAPFGIATYMTTAAIKEISIRPAPAHIPRIAFIAGKKSHGPGEHDYEKSLAYLQKQLDRQAEFIDTQLHRDGWPIDEDYLADADSIVVYCDGADHNEQDHPLLAPHRWEVLKKQMKRGAGLVFIHYAVFVPAEPAGKDVLNWTGGYFDYQNGDAANKWFSKIETGEYEVFPASPKHPISTGLPPFTMKEEFYFNIRFPEDKSKVTPILTFDPEKKDWSKVVAWAAEREGNGRGFATTGGHFSKNFENPHFQRLLLNAILWTAHAENEIGRIGTRGEEAKPAELP